MGQPGILSPLLDGWQGNAWLHEHIIQACGGKKLVFRLVFWTTSTWTVEWASLAKLVRSDYRSLEI